jgi:hypothetical protein
MADVPAPPRRPDDLTNVPGILVAAPLPPVRPTGLMVASAEPAALPLRTMVAATGAVPALAPVEHPAPPARPLTTASVIPRSDLAPRPAEPPASSGERAALRALFATTMTAHPPEPAARVASARARSVGGEPAGFVSDASPNPAMGFSRQPSADLQPNRFTGPAVRPLPLRP